MALLEVKDIDVFYGSVQALRSVSLSVDAGERVALLGANGAGKTTTLRTISGLLSPKRGSIVFDREEIAGLPAHVVVGKGVAHGPEGRALFPTLSVEENLRFGYLPRRKDRAGYGKALDRAYGYFPKLAERRKQAAGTMSGGEQQMLVVARALMSSPRLLIVDELSLGLAPKIVAQLFDIIRDVNAEGTAVVIVEQFVHMALQNTDRAYVLAKGEVVLERASSELAGSEELLRSYLGGDEEDGQPPAPRPEPRPEPDPEPQLDIEPAPAPKAKPRARSTKAAKTAKATETAKARAAAKTTETANAAAAAKAADPTKATTAAKTTETAKATRPTKPKKAAADKQAAVANGEAQA